MAELRAELPDRAARMALSCVVDAGDPALAALVAEVGAAEAWARVCESALGEPAARRASSVDHRQVAVLSRHYKVRFVVPGDEEWPSGLDDLRFVSPVQRKAGVPIGLWLRGPGHLGELSARSIAIVGSRAATPYGTETASTIAGDVTERGLTVVSGGAYGIDTAAHQGALGSQGMLNSRGSTIAVLANGVDIAYPKGNAPLLGTIARDHLIVSELPPGQSPSRVRFLARNRIIAAMSQGTVVVEAAHRSGARNTATWAVDCGRQLMAVPGPVYSALSAGPHQLVREGKATLVTSGSDVLELVSAMGSFLVAEPRGEERPTDDLDERRLSVFESLPSRSFATVEDIARRAGLAVPLTLAELGALERDGMIEGDDRGWRMSRPSSGLRAV
jgi:DNA processing protein